MNTLESVIKWGRDTIAQRREQVALEEAELAVEVKICEDYTALTAAVEKAEWRSRDLTKVVTEWCKPTEGGAFELGKLLASRPLDADAILGGELKNLACFQVASQMKTAILQGVQEGTVTAAKESVAAYRKEHSAVLKKHGMI